MSEAQPAVDEAMAVLNADDRAWLDEQLHAYAELLAYLKDH